MCYRCYCIKKRVNLIPLEGANYDPIEIDPEPFNDTIPSFLKKLEPTPLNLTPLTKRVRTRMVDKQTLPALSQETTIEAGQTQEIRANNDTASATQVHEATLPSAQTNEIALDSP